MRMTDGEDGDPQDFRYLEVNDTFERLIGFTRVEAVGRTVREIIPGIERNWIEMYAK